MPAARERNSLGDIEAFRHAGKGRDVSVVRRIMVSIIKGYQRHMSPLIGVQCRFRPSCSEYAVQAVNRHGVMRGGYLALRRIMKCHPLGPQGHDPVP